MQLPPGYKRQVNYFYINIGSFLDGEGSNMADDGTEDNMFSGEDQSGLDSNELRGGDDLTGTDDVMKNDPALLDEALDGNENDQVAFCLT